MAVGGIELDGYGQGIQQDGDENSYGIFSVLGTRLLAWGGIVIAALVERMRTSCRYWGLITAV